VSKEFNGEYDADENTILRIKNINGDITIDNWNNNKITLKAVTKSNLGSEKLDEIKLEVVEISNVLDIETMFLGTGSVDASTEMTIKIPDYVIIETISSSNGDIEIEGGMGNASVHSSNGDIIVSDTDGYIKADSSNGDIEIKDTAGIKDITTSNGRIYVEIVDFIDDIKVTSSNGDIWVYINSLLDADIDIETSNGEITMNDLSLNNSTIEDTYILGQLGNGGNEIKIDTSNGDIDLYKLY